MVADKIKGIKIAYLVCMHTLPNRSESDNYNNSEHMCQFEIYAQNVNTST